MTPDFTIRKGDLEPVFAFLAQYADGLAVDLAGATVKFIMTLDGALVPKISTAVGVVISDETIGAGSYAWIGTDTDTPGDYNAYVEITFSDGGKMSCPNGGFVHIQVTDVAE